MACAMLVPLAGAVTGAATAYSPGLGLLVLAGQAWLTLGRERLRGVVGRRPMNILMIWASVMLLLSWLLGVVSGLVLVAKGQLVGIDAIALALSAALLIWQSEILERKRAERASKHQIEV